MFTSTIFCDIILGVIPIIRIFEVINMSFKYTDEFILNCIELNKSGLTIREIAKFTGSKAKRIGERFKDFRYKPINHAVKQIPNNELISLYSQGWSVKSSQKNSLLVVLLYPIDLSNKESNQEIALKLCSTE